MLHTVSNIKVWKNHVDMQELIFLPYQRSTEFGKPFQEVVPEKHSKKTDVIPWDFVIHQKLFETFHKVHNHSYAFKYTQLSISIPLEWGGRSSFLIGWEKLQFRNISIKLTSKNHDKCTLPVLEPLSLDLDLSHVSTWSPPEVDLFLFLPTFRTCGFLSWSNSCLERAIQCLLFSVSCLFGTSLQRVGVTSLLLGVSQQCPLTEVFILNFYESSKFQSSPVVWYYVKYCLRSPVRQYQPVREFTNVHNIWNFVIDTIPGTPLKRCDGRLFSIFDTS